MLWIHGGGWSFGDRANERALALRFAERGIAVAAMSYRLCDGRWADPEAPTSDFKHPTHINDVADAFAWLHRNATALSIDAGALFVAGHSSGGHLAALLATDARHLEARGLGLGDIAAALPIGGAYDIPDYHAALTAGDDAELGTQHIHAVFGNDEAAWRDASPTHHLAASEVPMLVVVEEQAGFQRYAKRLDDAARAHGRENVELFPADGRTHGNVILLMSGRHADSCARSHDQLHARALLTQSSSDCGFDRYW